jgi:hypothetical protein
MDDTIKELGNSPVMPVKMDLDSKFSFQCHKGLGCFTSCCGRIDIFLTPYDVLRMKNRLDISSGAFLAMYGQVMELKKARIPLFMLRMTDDKKCPFVTKDGCTIYTDRPVACRYYPLGFGILKSTEVGGGDFFFPIKEEYCEGHNEDREWTVREWRNSQEINKYDFVNKVWLDIILSKKLLASQVVPDEKTKQLYLLASYDVDSFRSFVFESRFLNEYDVDQDTIDLIREDEVELLQFAHRWLRGVLFGEGGYKRKMKEKTEEE